VQGPTTMHVFVDRSGNVTIQNQSHVVSTLTNVANGKVVHVDGAGRDAFTPNGVVNPRRHHDLHRHPLRKGRAGLHLVQ